MSHTPHDLFAALVGAPALPGARCRGRYALFDERGPDESADVAEARHARALSLCRGCSALSSCQQWFESLPRSKRPPGVVAGRVSTPHPVGRPKESA